MLMLVIVGTMAEALGGVGNVQVPNIRAYFSSLPILTFCPAVQGRKCVFRTPEVQKALGPREEIKMAEKL